MQARLVVVFRRPVGEGHISRDGKVWPALAGETAAVENSAVLGNKFLDAFFYTGTEVPKQTLYGPSGSIRQTTNGVTLHLTREFPHHINFTE